LKHWTISTNKTYIHFTMPIIEVKLELKRYYLLFFESFSKSAATNMRYICPQYKICMTSPQCNTTHVIMLRVCSCTEHGPL
jgi:hypothetical protein